MKSLTIQGKKRESVGKNSTKALRNADQVPCVVYGGNEPIHFSADVREFKDLVYTSEAHTVVLELEDGEAIKCILQDIQFHPVTDTIIHADFYAYSEDKPITMNIPVILTGRAKGIQSGGVLRFNMRKLRVKAIPSKLPDTIEIDITPLKIGNKVYIKDLRNDDYALIHPDNAVVCMIKTARKAIVTTVDDDEEDADEIVATEQGGGEELNNEEDNE
ncbi:50S ribosomal protein L25/general stress protein Ctc [Flavobacteriaceae bacterium Ap0902]|nr:50S ribosomal protein L25/general stress protein Ctc [Flavobacteriaceae bacterium Ap0902]